MAVESGRKAPNFTLVDTEKQPRSLKEFRGKKLVLAFYPGAFTSVCTREMCTFRDSLRNLEDLGGRLVGVSVDSPFANRGFAEKNQLTFPLLSDYRRRVIAKYGLRHRDFGGLKGYDTAKRAVFVLDPQGIVRYKWVADDPGKEPPYEDVKQALARIK